MNLGKELKKARKEKGLTIDELQKRTKIRKKYLIALEKSNFSEIKGEVYVKSFIKGYAKAIGINPDPFIYEYEQHISDKKSDNNKINNENKDKSFFENNVFKKIVIILLIIVFLGTLGFWFFKNNIINLLHNPFKSNSNQYYSKNNINEDQLLAENIEIKFKNIKTKNNKLILKLFKKKEVI